MFNLYFEYSFPSEYLSVSKFKLLFEKMSTFLMQENTNNYQNYFYAFDLNQKCMLTFSDFLLGTNTVLNYKQKFKKKRIEYSINLFEF